MCNFLSSFAASAGPIICSYTPNIANKITTAKEMIFTISRIVLIKAIILNYPPLLVALCTESSTKAEIMCILRQTLLPTHNYPAYIVHTQHHHALKKTIIFLMINI